MATKRDPRLRPYVRLSGERQVVPGSLVMRKHKPKGPGIWIDITDCADICDCTHTTTTTSTTTSTTSTSTTTHTTTSTTTTL